MLSVSKGAIQLDESGTIESGEIWQALGPFIIPLGVTFILAMVLMFILTILPPGKPKRIVAISSMVAIPVTLLLLFVYTLTNR